MAQPAPAHVPTKNGPTTIDIKVPMVHRRLGALYERYCREGGRSLPGKPCNEVA